MGPQPEGCGIGHLYPCQDSVAWLLQWVHSPRAVVSLSHCVAFALTTPASMGPQPEGCGIAQSRKKSEQPLTGFNGSTARGLWYRRLAWPAVADVEEASMGPQPEGCGIGGLTTYSLPIGVIASMGPQPE